MNNDLISREALKEEVALMFGNKTHITESVCELIDNAPTVTPQAFINGIVELISKNGITTINELLETLKGGEE